MKLTSEEIERYARQIVLRGVGGPGQVKLRAARALALGAGGLGSPALQYLAGAGVGCIGVVDDDVVALSNLHRQVLHATADVGRRKVDSAEEAIRRINPNVSVEKIARRLEVDNARAIIADYDIVLNGSDNFATRYAVSDACFFERKPLVTAAIGEFDGTLTTLKPYERGAKRRAQPRPTAASSPRRRGREQFPRVRRRECSARSPAFSVADGARGDPRDRRRLRRRRSRPGRTAVDDRYACDALRDDRLRVGRDEPSQRTGLAYRLLESAHTWRDSAEVGEDVRFASLLSAIPGCSRSRLIPAPVAMARLAASVHHRPPRRIAGVARRRHREIGVAENVGHVNIGAGFAAGVAKKTSGTGRWGEGRAFVVDSPR